MVRTKHAVELLVLALTACSVSSEPSPPPPPPPPPPPALSLATTTVTVTQPLLLPGDTAIVTLQARDQRGQPFTIVGATVVFSSQGGTSAGHFQTVVDQQTGVYTAVFVADAMGTGVTITATVNGGSVTSTPPTLRVVGFTRMAVGGASLTTSTGTTSGGHTCGIITTGDMYCWGIAWFGLRGNGQGGTIDPAPIPTLVAGGHHWSEVSAAMDFVCAIATDSAGYCWGDGDVGQLGNGQSGNPPDVLIPGGLADGAKYQSIATTMVSGACGIMGTGAARCWGAGSWGRLGNGGEALANVPTTVSGGLTFTALSTGDGGTCAIATAGAAYCWGYYLMLGDTAKPHDTCVNANSCAKTPVPVTGGLTFKPIIAQDGNVTCAVASNNNTYCWGSGYQGDGTSEIAWGPRLVSGGLTFTALAGGDGFHCGIATGGAAYCWGANKNGRLGNTQTEALVPTPVEGGHTFTQLSLGQDHACGVATDGNAYCWGGNDKGELGDRSTTSSTTPVRVRLFY